MDITLYALDGALAHCWRVGIESRKMDGLRVLEGDILEGRTDAIVSPANSFGFMDGGIDAAYTAFFGPRLQRDVQSAIRLLPRQELLVGEALAVNTGNARYPCCIAAPTMRRPMRLWDGTNAYLAARAAVRLAGGFGLATLAMPGMGTGCGGLAPDVAARAMLDGIRDALTLPPYPERWSDVPCY